MKTRGLLIDVDGQLPNVALMKLSRHFKLQGRRVHLAQREVFAGRADEIAMAGNNLFGAGTESATIRFDIEEAPPELWLPEKQTGSTPAMGGMEGGAEMLRTSGVR